MKASHILYEIESQAIKVLENHSADPYYVVIGKEKYRTLVRHFRKYKIRGSDTKAISKRAARGIVGFENGLRFVVVDSDILEVSSDKTEELFRTSNGRYSDPEIFGTK